MLVSWRRSRRRFGGHGVGRVGSTAVQIAAVVGALFFCSAGVASAGEGRVYTDPEWCGLSMHGQGDGHCVWLRADPVKNYDNGWVLSAAWSCPATYPYPFIGFFSTNPVWLDRTFAPSPVRMKAVVPNPVHYEQQHGGGPYSWAGRGPREPGYVAVQILDQVSRVTVEIDYKCADIPPTIAP